MPSDMGLEVLGRGLVGALVEMVVGIEDGADGGVAEAVGNHLGILVLGNRGDTCESRSSPQVSSDATS